MIFDHVRSDMIWSDIINPGFHQRLHRTVSGWKGWASAAKHFDQLLGWNGESDADLEPVTYIDICAVYVWPQAGQNTYCIKIVPSFMPKRSPIQVKTWTWHTKAETHLAKEKIFQDIARVSVCLQKLSPLWQLETDRTHWFIKLIPNRFALLQAQSHVRNALAFQSVARFLWCDAPMKIPMFKQPAQKRPFSLPPGLQAGRWVTQKNTWITWMTHWAGSGKTFAVTGGAQRFSAGFPSVFYCTFFEADQCHSCDFGLFGNDLENLFHFVPNRLIYCHSDQMRLIALALAHHMHVDGAIRSQNASATGGPSPLDTLQKSFFGLCVELFWAPAVTAFLGYCMWSLQLVQIISDCICSYYVL